MAKIDDLKQAAAVIRDEANEAANTHTRVGDALLLIADAVEHAIEPATTAAPGYMTREQVLKLDNAGTNASEAKAAALSAEAAAKSAESAAQRAAHQSAGAEDAAKDVQTTLNGHIEYNHFSPATKQIIEAKGNGTITNLADDEDLENVEIAGKKYIREKSVKLYRPSQHSGMGRVILRLPASGNLLTQDMIDVNKTNIVYEIRYDFDLGGKTIKVGDNCVLEFKGGSLKNGGLMANNNFIKNNDDQFIFHNIKFEGTWHAKKMSPRWFGAKGDGVIDDTIAFREAVYVAHNLRIPLFVGDYTYYVTDTINTLRDGYSDLSITITANDINQKYTLYNITSRVVNILVKNGVVLFRNANMTNLAISGVNINGVDQDSKVVVFSKCDLNRINIARCTFCNLLAFEEDSFTHQLSEICYNRFQNLKYFAKVTDKTHALTDSSIHHNYITGSAYDITSYCFGYISYNGSSVYNNFIDYFKTMYCAKYVGAKQSGFALYSHDNEYQVFAYFVHYMDDNNNIAPLAYQSINDKFNHNTRSGDAGRYTLDTAVSEIVGGHQHESGITYVVPPYIYHVDAVTTNIMIDAIVEGGIDHLIFIKDSIGGTFSNNKATFLRWEGTKYAIQRIPQHGINGEVIPYKYFNSYRKNRKASFVTNVFQYEENVVDENLPSDNILGWSDYPIGYQILVNNTIYRLDFNPKTFKGSDDVSLDSIFWRDVENKQLMPPKKGLFNNIKKYEPLLEIGYRYICTDKTAQGASSAGVVIYYNGGGQWVDAFYNNIV